jgi:prolyl-tRNA editing enzyme YbaK/EbsC (Cys-tRNA(Pro) deacylase)/predicted Fe-S protein YdhL (DUF1289 family)
MSAAGPTPTTDGFHRVSDWLRERGHPHAPQRLDVAARTVQEAAEALGLQAGQIAKSVIFKRRLDGVAVLVVTSGDQRVDERKVAARVGALSRADADFVKEATGFSIGGVSPVAHRLPPVTLIDRELFRFDEVWAAAGHPNGVFRMSPQQLVDLTGAPVADIAQGVASPCIDVCEVAADGTYCLGCLRTLDEIGRWSAMDEDARRALLAVLAQRRGAQPPSA